MDGLGMRKGDYNRTSRWTESKQPHIKLYGQQPRRKKKVKLTACDELQLTGKDDSPQKGSQN